MVKQNTKAQKAKAKEYEPQFADVMDDGDGDVKYSLESVDNIEYINAEKNLFIKEDGTEKVKERYLIL